MVEQAPRTVETLHSALPRWGERRGGGWIGPELISPKTGAAFVHTETNTSAFAAVSSREWEGKRTVEGGQIHDCKLLILVSHK